MRFYLGRRIGKYYAGMSFNWKNIQGLAVFIFWTIVITSVLIILFPITAAILFVVLLIVLRNKALQHKFLTAFLVLLFIFFESLSFLVTNLPANQNKVSAGNASAQGSSKPPVETPTMLMPQKVELPKKQEALPKSVPVMYTQSNSSVDKLENPKKTESSAKAFDKILDCSQEKSNQDRLICSNAELNAADVQMKNLYSEAIGTLQQNETIKLEQEAWEINQRQYCEDVDCLKAAYLSRITRLENELGVEETERFSYDKISNPAGRFDQ